MYPNYTEYYLFIYLHVFVVELTVFKNEFWGFGVQRTCIFLVMSAVCDALLPSCVWSQTFSLYLKLKSWCEKSQKQSMLLHLERCKKISRSPFMATILCLSSLNVIRRSVDDQSLTLMKVEMLETEIIRELYLAAVCINSR